MAKLSNKLRNWKDSSGDSEGLTYYCQGCNSIHTIRTNGAGARWGWNGDVERPTFTPSVLLSRPANPNAAEEFKEYRQPFVCHSFVTEGMVQFLNDCTHHLAGQTVEMADLPEWLQD